MAHSIAILIDCWDTEFFRPQRMYQNIINFLNNANDVETVVVPNYTLDGVIMPTYPKLLELDKKYVNVSELDELKNFLQGITNIYLFGANWSQCVKYRPLGYLALSTLSNVSIMTVGDCVLEMGYKVDFTKETDWLKLKNNKYVYLRKRKQ